MPQPTKKAAASPAANGGLTFEDTVPPPRKGRGSAVTFSADAVAKLAEHLKSGKWAGVGGSDESRQKANTRITRIKRALIHYGHYKEGAEIRSRVYESDGGFKVAMADAEKVSG